MRQRMLTRQLTIIARRPYVWLLIALFLAITFLEDAQLLQHQSVLLDIGLTRYTVERILYLLPIIWAAFLFGWKGGVITSLAAVACMVPRAILSSPSRVDALVEISVVFIIGSLVSYSIESLRRERVHSSQLEAAQKELQFFLQQTTRAQEEERRRIALELHDDTIQSLVALCYQIDNLTTGVRRLPSEAKLRLEKLHQQTNTIMREVRRLTQDLRPAELDNMGLISALEWLTSDVEQYSGVVANLKVLGVQRRFSPEIELLLFRIAQEALRNVWKHAQASSAQAILEFADGKTRLTISDDGKGFDSPPDVTALPRLGKLGLAGMQERVRLAGGTLSIRSKPGNGTTITAEVLL